VHKIEGRLLARLTLLAAGLALVIMVLRLVVGIAPNFDTRVVGLAEVVWPGYAQDLRQDPEKPDCVVDDLREQLASICVDQPVEQPKPAADPFGDEDPFAAPKPAADPFGDEDPFAAPKPAADPFGDEDPFAAPKPAADPFGDEDPFAAPTDKPKPAVNCTALESLTQRCELRHKQYDVRISRISGEIRVFRSFELAISGMARFPFWKHLLVWLVMVGAFSTTAQRMHIALREPRTVNEFRVSQLSQIVVHLIWLLSCVADYSVQMNSTAEVENPGLPVIWAVGFACLSLVNIRHLFRMPAGLDGEGSVVRTLMVVPLYVYMGLIGAAYFGFVEQHSSGQAIYLHKFAQHPDIYLGIGLYIWAGMMLSTTRIAERVFDVLLPWRFPPAILVWIVVVLSAVPTAYSGASGIFVIAAGAVIFERLRSAGVPKRLAVAATAMSGSLGVVLRPCLVVVLVAMLNKQVTTDELFSNGLLVFGLTAFLFLIAMVLYDRPPWTIAPVGEALPKSLGALKPIAPYVLLGAGIMVFYGVVLGTHLSEHTAPLILPGLLLGLLIYDRWLAVRTATDGAARRAWPAIFDATYESASHTGALLCVMFASVGLGGVVERSELMSLVPESLGSVYLTMTILVVIMVLVGMTMDALGAVVLVSVTIAQVAYQNGIDPIHFWMMVLCAFELGYLTPPVAINHLLARQVIGPESHVENLEAHSRWERYEHVLLPMAVMSTALILVAYVPLFWYGA
jgi:TRAP-type C4-dicarboxylate transport system permease large subunit